MLYEAEGEKTNRRQKKRERSWLIRKQVAGMQPIWLRLPLPAVFLRRVLEFGNSISSPPAIHV